MGKALKTVNNGMVISPGDIPVKLWKCLEERAMEKINEEWRKSVPLSVFKNKGDVQSGGIASRISLFALVMERMRDEVRQESLDDGCLQMTL